MSGKTSTKAFDVVHMGPWEKLDQYELTHPRLKKTVRGKAFLRERLGLTGMELSLNKFPPGRAVPFLHRHKAHEELYLFVRGKGEIQVDGTTIPVEEGTCVRIAPSGARSVRNNSREDLYYVCIQAKDGSLSETGGSDGVPLEGEVKWPS
ncbi:cupin domain-containing protein [bacterium]|nr:cupin domain-containing protein [bacterium]